MSRHAREKNPEIRPSCELPLFEQNFYKFERTKSALSEAESAVSAGRTASPQRGHANRQPPREQTKSCLTAPLSANGESGDCRSLSDAQSLSSSPRDESATSGVRGFAAPAENRVPRESKLESRVANSLSPDVAHARNSDPQTSRIAAGRVTNSQKVKHAIYRILSIYGPLTDEQLIVQYRRGADMPPASDQSIRSRRSGLVHDGIVCDSGELGKSEMGNPAIIWKLK